MANRTVSKEITILKKARGYLKKGWCQFAWAKDKEGHGLTDWEHKKAVAWCLQGAIKRAADELKTPACATINASERVLQKQTGTLRSLMDWNDQPNRTQQEVVNFVDDVVLHLEKDTRRRLGKERTNA